MGKGRSVVVFKGDIGEFDGVAATAILSTIATNENAVLKKIQYNFVSREMIREINVAHLKHDYETDVITFDYSKGSNIVGDVYLCTDVISENAIGLKVSFKSELLRVVIHGMLHLVGYDDQTQVQKVVMRSQEEKYLNGDLL